MLSFLRVAHSFHITPGSFPSVNWGFRNINPYILSIVTLNSAPGIWLLLMLSQIIPKDWRSHRYGYRYLTRTKNTKQKKGWTLSETKTAYRKKQNTHTNKRRREKKSTAPGFPTETKQISYDATHTCSHTTKDDESNNQSKQPLLAIKHIQRVKQSKEAETSSKRRFLFSFPYRQRRIEVPLPLSVGHPFHELLSKRTRRQSRNNRLRERGEEAG